MIDIRGPTTGSSSGGLNLTLPTGWEENDLFVIACETYTGQAVTIPVGWTELPTSPQDAGGTSTRLTVFWKIAGASESTVAIADPGDHIVGVFFALGGVELSGAIGWSDGTTQAGSSTTANFEDVDGANVAPSDFVIFLASFGTDGSNDLVSYSMSNVQHMLSGTFASGLGNGGGIAYLCGYATNGSTVDATATLTNATPMGLITFTAIQAPDPNQHIYSGQFVTVGQEVLEDDSVITNGQFLTVATDLETSDVIFSAQMITVVVEQTDTGRRRNFMSFCP